jgi:hypothetical protein
MMTDMTHTLLRGPRGASAGGARSDAQVAELSPVFVLVVATAGEQMPGLAGRQHVAALTGQARDRFAAIDTAMRRLAEGSYGICGNCGQLIGAAHLATCIDCA